MGAFSLGSRCQASFPDVVQPDAIQRARWNAYGEASSNGLVRRGRDDASLLDAIGDTRVSALARSPQTRVERVSKVDRSLLAFVMRTGPPLASAARYLLVVRIAQEAAE